MISLPVRSAAETHKCRCRAKVPVVDSIGVMLWSESAVVTFKLAAVFDADGAVEDGFRVAGEGWRQRLASFLDLLSPIERADVRAAAIERDGSCKPWAAVSAQQFQLREEASWLPEIMNNDRMVPFYQPIVDIASGRTIAYEALMRAELNGKLLSGGQLIDAARAHNALFQFDQKARTKTIRHSAGRVRPGELLFINFMPMVIYDPAICLQSTWEAAQEVGWEMEKLVFEVVESDTFPDINHLRKILDAYRDHGCQVALDDFGTGHTALSYIEELRPNVVKFAKGLIPEFPREDDLALIKGLNEHAKNRGVTTLIEGVETQQQLDTARRIGIDLVQGYLLGRPAAEPLRTLIPARSAA